MADISVCATYLCCSVNEPFALIKLMAVVIVCSNATMQLFSYFQNPVALLTVYWTPCQPSAWCWTLVHSALIKSVARSSSSVTRFSLLPAPVQLASPVPMKEHQINHFPHNRLGRGAVIIRLVFVALHCAAQIAWYPLPCSVYTLCTLLANA